MNIFKRIVAVHLLILGLSGLTACATTPEDIGISSDQWAKYDKTKQEKLMESYQKLEEVNKLEDKKVVDQYQSLKNDSYEGDYLKVRIYNGKAMMPPFVNWYNFQETTFEIIPDTCTNALLKEEANDPEVNEVSMRACFKNNILYLDPSRFESSKEQGTVRFANSPLWDLGFTYNNINSNGYARLKDVSVEIKHIKQEHNF